MYRVKAVIITDVEYLIDVEDHRDIKRKLQDKLAVDGYKNAEVTHFRAEKEKVIEWDLDIDFSRDLKLDHYHHWLGNDY